MLKTQFLLIANILFFTHFTLGKNLNILSFGGNHAASSGELTILLEDLANTPEANIKIISTREGIGYKNKSTYLAPQEENKIFKSEELAKLSRAVQLQKNNIIIFESARAFMVLEADSAKNLMTLLKTKINNISKVNNNTRFWNDLKYFVAHAHLSDALNKYEVRLSVPNADVHWKVAPYLEYILQYNEEKIKARVFAKDYGGLQRIVNALEAQAKQNSILISAGNYLQDDGERYDLLAQIFNKYNNAYIVANEVEINNLEHPYVHKSLKKISEERVLSANLCEKIENNCKTIFKPYVSLNINGLKVAVVGYTNPELQSEVDKNSARFSRLKNFKIQNPKEFGLENFILKLRTQHDIIVLATNMYAGAVDKHLIDFTGADFLIFRDSRKWGWDGESQLEVKNYLQRFPLFWMKKLDISSIYINSADINITHNDLKVKTKRIMLDQAIESGHEINDVYPQSYLANFYNKQYVLPDHRLISPNKLVPGRYEFAKMCAQILLENLNAEVGIWDVQYQSSTVIGHQDEIGVRTWIKQNDYAQVVYLKGSELKQVRTRSKAYVDDDGLVLVGISDDEKINGLAIKDNELYRVALPKSVVFASRFEIKPETSINKFLVQQDGQYIDHEFGTELDLADFIITELKKQWKNFSYSEESKNNYLKQYARLYEGKSLKEQAGYWTHSLDNLSVEYSQLTTTDTVAFSSVQDGRLKTVDQRYFATNLNYKASFNKYPFINELGLSARYSKLELLYSSTPATTSILDDQIRLFANIAAPIYTLENQAWLGRDYGPYFEIAYNTEFEPESGLSIEKKIDALAGLKALNGVFFKNASIALMVNRYLTGSVPRNVTGANLKLEADRPLGKGGVQYKASLDYSYFFDDDSVTAGLRSRFILDQSLNLNVARQTTFGPYIKYFSLSRNNVDENLDQTMIGVTLTYSDFWKPKFIRTYTQ